MSEQKMVVRCYGVTDGWTSEPHSADHAAEVKRFLDLACNGPHLVVPAPSDSGEPKTFDEHADEAIAVTREQ